jgi:hypothetical protein
VNLRRSIIASRAILVPASRLIRSESSRSAIISTTLMLRDEGLSSTMDRMNEPAATEEAVERNRIRLARKMRSGELDF